MKIENQSEEIESVGYIPDDPYKVSEENCYQCTKDGEPCFFHTNYTSKGTREDIIEDHELTTRNNPRLE